MRFELFFDFFVVVPRLEGLPGPEGIKFSL
jgi:hypothetical protein